MIHQQLQDDCHLLGRFESCAVLLHRNAALPWFILVPTTELEDVLDLPAMELGQVIRECQHLSEFLKKHLRLRKVNFAGLGNVVPQMHLHVIGRSETDACWPQPVWGHRRASGGCCWAQARREPSCEQHFAVGEPHCPGDVVTVGQGLSGGNPPTSLRLPLCGSRGSSWRGR